MEIVQELVHQARERLEDLDFYESWTDDKVSKILEKLRSVENDIVNLRDTIENSRVMPSLKTPSYQINDYSRLGAFTGSFMIPDTRDQWRRETNGDLIAKEWTKFMETASNEEKIKALTEIVRTLTPGTSV